MGAPVRAHRKTCGSRQTPLREAGQPVSVAPGCPVRARVNGRSALGWNFGGPTSSPFRVEQVGTRPVSRPHHSAGSGKESHVVELVSTLSHLSPLSTLLCVYLLIYLSTNLSYLIYLLDPLYLWYLHYLIYLLYLLYSMSLFIFLSIYLPSCCVYREGFYLSTASTYLPIYLSTYLSIYLSI